MSRKPAELSANLVAIKGSAAPAPDMPGRVAAPTVSAAAKGEAEGRVGLNLQVSAAFRREFRTYAATHDLKLVELVRLGFEAYRREQGD